MIRTSTQKTFHVHLSPKLYNCCLNNSYFLEKNVELWKVLEWIWKWVCFIRYGISEAFYCLIVNPSSLPTMSKVITSLWKHEIYIIPLAFLQLYRLEKVKKEHVDCDSSSTHKIEAYALTTCFYLSSKHHLCVCNFLAGSFRSGYLFTISIASRSFLPVLWEKAIIKRNKWK